MRFNYAKSKHITLSERRQHMSRTHAISTLIFVIALAIYGYMQWQKSSIAPVIVVAIDEPDFIATYLTSKKYNSDGQLAHTIFAKEMRHFEGSGDTELIGPKFTIFPEDNRPAWDLSAESGKLTQDNILTLNNDVKLVSADKSSFISHVYGQQLIFDLNTSILSSEQPIIMQGKDFTMRGSMLHVDVNTTEIKLNKHEHTVFKKHQTES